jgi:hypothetical protein
VRTAASAGSTWAARRAGATPSDRAAAADGDVGEPVEHVAEVDGVVGEQRDRRAPRGLREPVRREIGRQRRQRGDGGAELVQHHAHPVHAGLLRL